MSWVYGDATKAIGRIGLGNNSRKRLSKWIYSVESLNCRFWSPRKRIYLELEIWESKHKHGVYTEADRMNW